LEYNEGKLQISIDVGTLSRGSFLPFVGWLHLTSFLYLSVLRKSIKLLCFAFYCLGSCIVHYLLYSLLVH